MKGERVGGSAFQQRGRSPFLFSIVLKHPGQSSEEEKMNKQGLERKVSNMAPSSCSQGNVCTVYQNEKDQESEHLVGLGVGTT